MSAAAVLQVPPRLDAAGLLRLEQAVAEAPQDRAWLLVGEAPPTFCAGMALEAVLATPPEAVAALLDRFAAVLLRIRTAPVPVIAQVEGRALGGGLGIVAAADVVLATEAARLGLPEVRAGLTPAVVGPLLAERLSPQRCRALALRGTALLPAEALAWGLVDAVCAPLELDPLRRRWMRDLRRAVPSAVRAIRGRGEEALRAAVRAGVRETAARLADPAVRAHLADMYALLEGT